MQTSRSTIVMCRHVRLTAALGRRRTLAPKALEHSRREEPGCRSGEGQWQSHEPCERIPPEGGSCLFRIPARRSIGSAVPQCEKTNNQPEDHKRPGHRESSAVGFASLSKQEPQRRQRYVAAQRSHVRRRRSGRQHPLDEFKQYREAERHAKWAVDLQRGQIMQLA